jgi:EAL domain-containing protein (putative c-di-GMP-specific phosphodiesterase class I)
VDTAAAPSSDASAVDWPAALQRVFTELWRIRPAFQPIIDLPHGRTWGFQVLARFISPVRATPPEWLAAAEELGLRDALEARLVAAGVQAVGDLPDGTRLLLPVSPGALLAPAVKHALRVPGRTAERIVLDVTPGARDHDVDRIADATDAVRRHGLGIAYLAGNSPGGLDALPRLRPDVLKLGREYVAGVEDDGDRRAVVDGLSRLVGALGGRLLAVGIESRAQLDALRAAGIALGQGFGFGRPVPSMAASLTRGTPSLLDD